MAKIIEIKKKQGTTDDTNGLRITKEFCGTCGGSLDLWSGDDGVAYGVCNYCDLDIGQQPIVLIKATEH
jgi:hypothetical protein